jgi:transposase
MKLTSAYLGHHGLVAGMFDELGIGNIIDKTLPKQGQHKLPHSVIVKAMLINFRIEYLGESIHRYGFFSQWTIFLIL